MAAPGVRRWLSSGRVRDFRGFADGTGRRWWHSNNGRVPSPGAASPPENEPHHQRQAAEAFGSDPERYDRARPRYPEILIERIVAAAPGGLVLDVGAATGIVARQFQAAGCQVLGVDPDARLAEFARRSGVPVEVSRFEAWETVGRKFDAVVSGESWHWVDPVAGAAKAAEVLRPGGRLAVFWNTGQPSAGLDEAFVEVYRRVLSESLASRLGRKPIEEAQSAMRAKAADGIRATGAFHEPSSGGSTGPSPTRVSSGWTLCRQPAAGSQRASWPGCSTASGPRSTLLVGGSR